MDMKRLRVALKVLEAVKDPFSNAKNFIEDLTDKQYLKEKIPVEEVIFEKGKSRSKELAQKNIFYFVGSMLIDI